MCAMSSARVGLELDLEVSRHVGSPMYECISTKGVSQVHDLNFLLPRYIMHWEPPEGRDARSIHFLGTPLGQACSDHASNKAFLKGEIFIDIAGSGT